MTDEDIEEQYEDVQMIENQIEEDENGLPYDPDQNSEERRAIRKGYRALQEDEALQNPSEIVIDALTEKVQEANTLFARVKGPQEATLDSAFLLTASNLTALKARQMKSTLGGFDIDDFVAKLITFMGGRRARDDGPREDGESEEDFEEGNAPLEWEKIGRKALAKSRRVPAMDFMLGPLNIEHKKRNIMKRAKLEKEKYEEKKPQELKEEDIQRSENETTKNVAALERLLGKESKPINLFKFIVNPHDFGQTVENLFYLSFLIRDAKCALDVSEDTNEPTIFLSEPPTDEEYLDGQLKKNQMVMEMDMETWKRAIEVFDIREPRIPTRKPAPTTFIRQRKPD